MKEMFKCRKGKTREQGGGQGVREECKSINSLMSQQSGINQFHVAQFLPIRKNMRCCAASAVQHAGSCLQAAQRYSFPYIFTNICFSTHASTQCTQPTPQTIRSRRYDWALGTVEEKGNGEGRCWWGWWWLQLDPDVGLLTSVAPVHEHMLSFGEVFLQTDWLDRSSFLFFFQTFTVWRSIRLWLLSTAPIGPSGLLHHSTVHPTETRTNILLLQHESERANSMPYKNDSLLWIYSNHKKPKRSCMELRVQQSHVEETSWDCLLFLSPVLWAFWLVGIGLLSPWFPLNPAFPSVQTAKV